MLLDTNHLDMLTECEEASFLSDWETGFIASIRKLADDEEDRSLSPAQASKLEQIYEKRCS